MPSSTVNICVLTLVLLSAQQLCDARPSKTKREINKDYFHSLSEDQLERRADDKHYLKKSKIDSEVKYVSDEKNGASPNDLKSPVIDIAKDKADLKIEKEPLKAVETEKKDLEVIAPKPIPPPVEEAKDVKELLSLKSDTDVDETVKKAETSEKKAPFTPVDPKFVVPPKPDSKDEIEVKTNLPPTSSEEEKIGEKVDIGQIPHMYPRLIPIPNTFRVPILIPIQKIAYGSVSVVPLPPAAIYDRLPLPPAAAVSDRLPLPPMHDVSDRLPMPFEDDIVGEGGPESAEIEEAAELAAERKVEKEGYPANPLPLSLLSFSGLLKDLKDTSFEDGEKETKVVDVLGKKFVMQSNVVKYPSSGNGNTFIRFLSVKPLEKVEKDIMKEVDSDKSIEDGTLEVKAKEVSDEFSAKKDEGLKSEESFEKAKKSEVEKETVTEMVKDPEILKAEETQILYNIHPEVPKEIVLKETVGGNLKKEGVDLVEEQTEKTEDVVNDEKMVEVKHSFVEEEIKTEKGEKAKSSEEIEGTVLKMKPDIEGGEIVYRIKMQEAEEKKKKLKGDEGDLSAEEEGSKEIITVADSFLEKSGGDDMIESSKKEYFLPEKKKKEITKGDDKLKSKKSSKEKKSKKKCTCEEEEEDSGSDYSSVESDDDY